MIISMRYSYSLSFFLTNFFGSRFLWVPIGCQTFIFSLYNVHGYKPVKQSQYRYQGYAIYHCSSYGPTFGGYQGGNDIQLRNNAGNIQSSFTTCGCIYAVPTGYIAIAMCVFFSGSELFTPTDLEVFYEITS